MVRPPLPAPAGPPGPTAARARATAAVPSRATLRGGGRDRPPRVPRSARRGTGAATVALVPAALMLVLGLWGVRRENSMWRDESTTYQVAHRSSAEIWHLLGGADAVHGAYYLVMHAVFTVWDGGLIALRLPSVLAMAVAAAFVGLTGRRLAGPRAGLAAGLVFPLLPQVQQYAQEGRSYAMVCAAVAVAGYLLTRAVARPGRRVWAGYAAALVVACLLHEFAVLVLLAHGLTLLSARVPQAVRWAWGAAAGAVAVVLAPLVVISQQQSAQVAWLNEPTWGQWQGFAGFALVGTVLALAPVRPGGPLSARRFALPLLTVPWAALLLVSHLHPLYSGRYVLYAHLGLALLAGVAVDRLPRHLTHPRPVAAALAAVVVAALLPSWLALRGPGVHMDDTNAVSAAVREVAAPGDGVLFMPAQRRESRLSHPGDFAGLRDLALDREPASGGTLYGTEAPVPVVRSRMLAVDRIVTITDPPGRPVDHPPTPQDDIKRAVLQERFERCARRKAGGLVITVYARPGRC